MMILCLKINYRKKNYRHGNQLAVINSVKITDLDNTKISKVETGTTFKIIVSLEAKEELEKLIVGISLRNLMGLVIYGINTHLMNVDLPDLQAGQQLKVCFQIPCHLNKGIYTFTVGIHSEEGISYDWVE